MSAIALFQSAMSSNRLAAARHDVVPGSPTSPWWSTVDERTAGALSADHDVGHGHYIDVGRHDWPASGAQLDRQRASGIHVQPSPYDFLTAWRLIHGRRPLGT